MIGYTMLGRPGNAYLTETIPLDAFALHVGGSAGIALSPELQYGMRLGSLLAADGFIIAGGGPGTLTELLAIMDLGAKVWSKPKRVAIVPGWGENDCEPWSGEMLAALSRFVPIDDKVRWAIRIVNMPEAAVAWATGDD